MVAIADYSNTKPYPNRQNLDDKTIHSKTAALQTEDRVEEMVLHILQNRVAEMITWYN